MKINQIMPTYSNNTAVSAAPASSSPSNTVAELPHKKASLSALQAYSNISFKGAPKAAQDLVDIVILLGKPGSGKGTGAKGLKNLFGIPQISTGDLLRAARDQGTELGKKANEYMSKGQNVPDELVIGLVKEAIPNCPKGCILDGFPRTVEQAKALDEILAGVDNKKIRIINLDVQDSVIVERAANRLVCSDKNCGEIFSARTYKSQECKCGAPLKKRDDDRPEVVMNRLKEYEKVTAPVADYYKKRPEFLDIKIDATAGKDTDPNLTLEQMAKFINSEI